MKKILKLTFIIILFFYKEVIFFKFKAKWAISIIFFLFFFKLSFAQTEILENKIKLNDFKGTAKEILDKIQKKENIVFAYSSEISLYYEVSFSKGKMILKEFLEILFNGKQIGYKVNGDKILLFHIKELPAHVEKATLTTINGIVKDLKTKEPLGFCNIAVKGTKKGVITNIEGAFSIILDVSKDVLLISYIGYEKQSIQASKLLQKQEIYLQKKELLLKEVVIHANDDYLYDIIEKCRKNLMQNKAERTAKLYFALETRSKLLSVEYPIDNNWTNLEIDSALLKEKPVELLECYYNAQFKGSRVDELGFKNGRTALASNNNYFVNMGSSKAICEISLTNDNGMFPEIPLQLNKRGLRKNFFIELAYFDGKYYTIKFHPKNNKNSFSGEVWIESETYNLLKINLKAENTVIHPFLPEFPRDSIYNVSFDICNTYKNDDELTFPDHFVFNYSITYRSRKDTIFLYRKNLLSEIKSKSIMFFYDYDKPFILPYFEYTDMYFGRDDYQKISFFPYNEAFWNSNNVLLQTEKQKQEYGLLSNQGELINYREGNYSSSFLAHLPGRDSLPGHLEFYYPFWNSRKRLVPKLKSDNFKIYSKEKINSSIRSDLYNLKVQIMLDIVESGDSMLCKSYTIFDSEQTYYHIPLNFYSNAFFNIYFDIWEIERRSMQDKLNVGNLKISQINEIYNNTIENLNTISEKYIKEVNVGENEKMLKKWNDYVFDKLDIDNMKMVENSVKK
ncbi:MAG: carboxypeptidase-like regulatory domain-containing protein [Bacteroidales bacterium]